MRRCSIRRGPRHAARTLTGRSGDSIDQNTARCIVVTQVGALGTFGDVSASKPGSLSQEKREAEGLCGPSTCVKTKPTAFLEAVAVNMSVPHARSRWGW